MPISEELKAAIIEDLKEDRLTFAEIAAKRLGNPAKKAEISHIARAEGLSRKDRRGKSRKSYKPKVKAEKSPTIEPSEIITFGANERLSLIDLALTQLKLILPKSCYPKGMMEWTASLERLLTQRREEDQKGNEAESELLDKFVTILDNHANAISPKASRSLQPASGHPPDPPIRVGEERQD